MAEPASTREYGLDWLRVIAFAVLIFYHTGMFFVPWEWHVKNNQLSEELTWAMLFFNRWRLPLLFFISGCGVWFALRGKRFTDFAGERLRRLLVPLIFGMLVIVPPQIYFERKFYGVVYASYAEFYPSVFRFVPYPEGNFSWHHLWFVAYILVFSLVMLPVFAALKSPRGRALTELLVTWLERPGVIYLVNIPSLLVAFTLGPRWPTTHNLIADWANLTGSLVTFLWGFLFASSPKLLELLDRRRGEWLAGAIVLTGVFYLQRLRLLDFGAAALIVLNSFLGMLWIFTLVGYSRHWLNHDSAFLRYSNEAVYPFYIVHQTITVTAGYYLAPWDLSITAKLIILAGVTFLGSWALFELVKRTAVTRLLFGLKPARTAST